MDRRQYCLSAGFVLLLLCAGTALAGVFDALDKLSGPRLGGERAFLDPDAAFRFSHSVADGRIHIDFDIEPGYYLYRDKMKLTSDDPAVHIGELQLPEGEIKDDPEFGRVSIYRLAAAIDAPLSIDQTAGAETTLVVAYQGCAEDAICYPPIKKTIRVDTAMLETSAAAGPGPVGTVAPPRDSADEIALNLAGGSLLAVAGTFFVFGLLLAFTPCVFPMVPILSGIIVGQAQPVTLRRGLVLSGVYVVAVAVTYAVAGLAAGLFGHNLQAMFQQPWVIVSFSFVFVALALSMFGFYELQIPRRAQTALDRLFRAQDSDNLAGVALMGVLSAIIVGPCVAPPLAGALLYLGHEGSPVTGGTALFALGLGMGAPLMLVGASAGRLLPRAGAWMDVVKQVFGVLLLAVAIWFLERILPGPVTLALWAILAIVSAIFLGALDRLSGMTDGWRRLSKGFGLALLCYGVVLIVGAAAGGGDPFNPLEPLTRRSGAPAAALAFKPIKGIAGLDEALTAARLSGRPAMLDFYADWCIECKHLERNTFQHAAVQAALSDFVLLRADVTANDDSDRALLQRFELFGPPAVLFFDHDGTELRRLRVLGFLPADEFGARLAALK